MTTDSKVRFGVIGVGRFGMRQAEAIRAHPKAELAAVAAATRESAARAAELCRVPAFVGYTDMLARDDLALDVVSIVTPNTTHEEIALDALDAGKHILVEKPMATTVEGCDAIIDAANRSGRVVYVGHKNRVSPLWGRAKMEIEIGNLGRPLSVSLRLWRREFRRGADGWRFDRSRVGDWILEEPVHFMDLARWYLSDLGEPLSLHAAANGRTPELHENLAVLIKYDGGFAAVSHTTAGAGHHLVGEITGTDASLRVTWDAAADQSEPLYRLEIARGSEATEIPITTPPSEIVCLHAEIDALVRHLQDGSPLPIEPEDGRWAVRMCVAAAESIQTGDVVPLSAHRLPRTAP